MKKRNIVVLGSTGSIGVSSLSVAHHLSDRLNVIGLSANQNISLLWKQIQRFSPKVVAVEDTSSALKLKGMLKKTRFRAEVLNHQTGLESIASHRDADVVISGVVGFRGLDPLVAALKAKKTVGLANKEALIVAGDVLNRLAKKTGAKIVPVDSEHSAIFQCLQGRDANEVERIILTASGGPFYRSEQDLDTISVEQALDHPTWKMGKKITVDSATLMNKGLEAIEAHHLFGIPMNRISIVIHPQSIVHSMVEFRDGSVLAQLSHPDMRLPIQYAMTYPDRLKTQVKPLRLEHVGKLEFAQPDFSRFPCLSLALKAGIRGGTAPAVLSASNEEAVYAFIEKRISFMSIPIVVSSVLKAHQIQSEPTLNDVKKVDQWARERARREIKKMENKKHVVS